MRIDIGDRKQLFSLAIQTGLDLNELGSYLENGKTADKLNQHLQEVREYGIDEVPAFIAGNKMVVRAQPYPVLEKVLDEAFPIGSRARKTG